MCKDGKKQKIVWRGYTVTENQTLQDTNVVQFFFRNRGNSIVSVNGMRLYPVNLDVIPVPTEAEHTTGDEFLEELNACCEKSYGIYDVEFIPSPSRAVATQLNVLEVYTKTFVDQGGDY